MPAPTVPQRIAPGGAYSLSAVALALPPPVGGSVGVRSMAVPLLRKARSLGVTTFDLSGQSFPAAAEEILVEAFPEKDPNLVAVLGLQPSTMDANRRGAAFGSRGPSPSRTPIEESLRRLGGRFRVLVDCDPLSEATGRPPASLVRLREEGQITDIAVRWRPGSPAAFAGEASLRSASLSLLALDLIHAVGRSVPAASFALIARDVFAGGALDGSLLEGSVPARGPAGPPPSLAELHGRLDPILRLGFLTRGRSRTLAQAALGFALHWPWVLTAVVPLPAPERLAAVLGAASGPEFSEEELERIGVAPGEVGREPNRGTS